MRSFRPIDIAPRRIVIFIAGLILLCSLVVPAAVTHAQSPAEAQQDYSTFEVHFDSTTTTHTSQGSFQGRVEGRILISETEATHYQGTGRLAYRSFSGPVSYGLLDGILRVFDATIPANQGEITMHLFPGNPKPHEYTVVPQAGTIEYYHWFGAFGALHMDEFGNQGYEITGWEFPGGDVYARKVFDRSEPIGGATYSEHTVIELIGRPPAPTITQITSKGIGTAGENPETGSDVRLEGDIENTAGYEVTACTWTGDLPQPETTTPVSNTECRLTYTPETGPGPERATYGPKDVTLTIIYEHSESGATGLDQKTHSYKVFFAKYGDDNSDGVPNWFEYWGDDGAVPGLDAPDVIFDESIDSLGGYDRTDDVIRIGKGAAKRVKPRSAPATGSCPGFSHPSTEGIDAAAVTIVHEGKHKELEHKRRGEWASLPDTDGDGVPDSVETNSSGTNPNDPDSCNLGQSIHSSYTDDGDDEFVARTVHGQAVAVPENDWANPGKQTDPPFLAAGTQTNDTLLDVRATTAASASLTGSYSDSTTDTDSDGNYDTLTVSADVNVTTGMSYNLVMTLTDGAGTEIATTSTVQSLAAGAHTVDLVFEGETIREVGIDGPYHVERVELRAPTEFREVLADAGDDVYATAGYQATDFDRPDAVFTGSLSDNAVDTGSDGLYDELRITADLDVQTAGTYTITGELDGTNLGLVASTSQAMSAGANTVTLTFDGTSLFQYREDGPYTLDRLYVTNAAGEVLDVAIDAHTTAAYDHTQFQHGGTTIDTSTYSDHGVDATGDGKYEELQVEFKVISDAAGPYSALATLASNDGETIATTSQAIGLTGSISATLANTVTLGFDGAAIADAGVDGPYTLTSVALIAENGSIADFHPVAHTTQAYSATDFAALRKVYLPVVVR